MDGVNELLILKHQKKDLITALSHLLKYTIEIEAATNYKPQNTRPDMLEICRLLQEYKE